MIWYGMGVEFSPSSGSRTTSPQKVWERGQDLQMKKRAFVTGGGGYVGSRLCKELAARGYVVTAFDIYHPEKEDGASIQTVQGDVRDSETVKSAVAESKADVVFHVASFGMSGREMLNREKIEAVNIGGTKNVIEEDSNNRPKNIRGFIPNQSACVDCGVTRLVYTSTYNVVFGGQEIHNGDESIPYLPMDKHVDHYSRTKSVAEQEVMVANGREVKGGNLHLKTCALRCAGIYGEGEQRHLPRIVAYIERGFFRFTYGGKDNLVDFLHADNFVQAHIKAAEACDLSDSPVPGQVYFISDGKPINNFKFFKPLVEGLGYSYPRVGLPLSLIYFIALLIEIIHGFMARHIYNFQPLLTRAEVFKTGVTHYFSVEKARRDFGYSPKPKDLKGVVRWFRERGHGRQWKKHNRVYSIILNVAIALLAIVIVMGCLPVVR